MQTQEIPFYHIRIDKEGVWYYRGAEMFRREIVNFFYENLSKDDSGRYLIELENDRCYLEVEDTAFVVRAVRQAPVDTDGVKRIILMLSDDTTEILDPASLWIGDKDVLYCKVKDGRFEARFLRPAYYQLAGEIEYDEKYDRYYIPLNGIRYYLMSS